MRTKRGGRKTSGGADDNAKAESAQPETSPRKPAANGATNDDDNDADKTPFERYSDEQRAILEAKGDGVDVEDELTKGWEALDDADKERYAKSNTKTEKDDKADEAEAPDAETAKEDAEKPAVQDEDVEMRDDEDTPMGKDE